MDTFCSDSLKADMSAVTTFEGVGGLHNGQLLKRRKLRSEVTNTGKPKVSLKGII